MELPRLPNTNKKEDKKFPSNSSKKAIDKVEDLVLDIEVDADIHMAPQKEYPVKLKISKIEKGRPMIDPRELKYSGYGRGK